MYRSLFHNLFKSNLDIRQMCKKSWNKCNTSSFPQNLAAFSKEEYDEYMSMYPQIVEDITNIEPYNKLPNFKSNIKNLLDYNATIGTHTTGLVTIYAYKMMANPKDRTPENLQLAIIMGWCMRLYEASRLIIDDLFDDSSQRYQQPSWHSLPHIGNTAALHGFLLNSCIDCLLQKYFAKHPQYTNIQRIFSKSVLHSNITHYLDLLPYDEKNMTEEYLEINNFGKVAFTTFNTYCILGAYFSNIPEPKLYDEIQKILITIGFLWSMQNDFLDTFDDPRKRQPGMDIKESRITWLSVTAYNKCNSKQKKFFNEYYGKNSIEAVNNIINLYRELKMPALFEEASLKFEKRILNDVKKLPDDVVPHEFFYRILSNVQQQLSTTF